MDSCRHSHVKKSSSDNTVTKVVTNVVAAAEAVTKDIATEDITADDK
jgi:hypothetical protein